MLNSMWNCVHYVIINLLEVLGFKFMYEENCGQVNITFEFRWLQFILSMLFTIFSSYGFFKLFTYLSTNK